MNVNEMRLLEPAPLHEMPNADPDPNCADCSHLLSFNFDGESFTASVNGRNFIFPAHPPQTQYDDFMNKDNRCDLSTSCNPFNTIMSLHSRDRLTLHEDHTVGTNE